jgi:hypothetical protein
MLAEHIVYSTALAIVVGMLCLRYTGRDVSWIIIVLAWAPDIDYLFTVLDSHRLLHGTFHNVAAMVFFAVIITYIISQYGIRPIDAFILSFIGFGAHLFEDALVFPSGYMLLWPFYRKNVGLGWLDTSGIEETYDANFFHIANTEVLFIGLVLLLFAILVRTGFEGTGWIRWYMPENVYRRYFTKNK